MEKCIVPSELKRVRRKTVATVGLPCDNNHDPSNIIRHDGRYYLWYTQHLHGRPYDHFNDCVIMVTTSEDGIVWNEGRVALAPSEKGWDDGGVLTANVFKYDSMFYMWYIGVGKDYDGGCRDCSLVRATSPDGPFERFLDTPILVHGKPGSWNDNSVDDVSTLFFRNRWLTYFKGMSFARNDGDLSMIGRASSDSPLGPYALYAGNPIIRGHAFSIWNYRNGLLLLSGLKDKEGEGFIYKGDWNDTRGHQYLYYSDDGIDFIPCAEFENRASGIYVPEGEAANWIENYWGVSVKSTNGHYGRYIERFDFVVEDAE